MTLSSGEQTVARPEARATQPTVEASVIAPQDRAEIAKVAAEGIKGDPRRALKFIRNMIGENFRREKGMRPTQVLKSQLEVLKKSKDPQDRALALDFEIVQKQYESGQIDNAIALYQIELGKPDITAEARTKYESVIKQLRGERDGIRGEDGVIQQKGASQMINELRAERVKISGDIPNSFQELASMIGISPQEAEANPLQAVMSRLESVKGDKNAQAAFRIQLSERGFPRDAQNELSNTFRVMIGEPTKIEKTRNIMLKGAGIAGLLSIIMAWLASKDQGPVRG